MKNIDANKFKTGVTFSILSAVIVVFSLIFLSLSNSQSQHEERQQQEYSKQVTLSIEHIIKHFVQDYTYRVRRMVETTNIRELLKNGDRESLYKLLQPKFKLMREESSSFTVMHIHKSDGTSLLRVHKPEKYGDKISDVRVMLRDIHKNHKLITGYETGKYATVFRIISPIFDKDGVYLGAFEVGMNPKFIIEAVNDINGFCGMVFIKLEDLQLYSTPSSVIVDGYKLQSEMIDERKAICEIYKVPRKLEGSIEINEGDIRYITHLVTIKNFSGDDSVKIVFFQRLLQDSSFFNSTQFLLYGFIFFILSVMAWYVYSRIGRYQKNIQNVYLEQIEKINESERRFELLYEKAPDAYQSLDIDGNLIIVNAKWTEELGYTHEEAMELNFVDVLAPGFREKFKENFPKFKAAGGITGIEFDMLTKDGEVITVSFNGKIVRDEKGEFIQTHCIFTNITERKHIEKELKFNENYLQRTFDVIPNIMITTDGVEIDKVNLAMLEFFNYKTLEDFRSNHECICDFFIADRDCLVSDMDGTPWLEYILEKSDELHYVSMNKDGIKHHFIVQAHALEIDDKYRSVVIFSDITESKNIKERLEIAVTGTNDGLWDWNLITGDIYFSPQWKKQLGYEDDELENSLEIWESHVHPDDKEAAITDYTANMEGKTEFYENIHRLRHKDGSWIWILDRGQAKFDENGKAIRMVGFHTDITEQKELESRLIENEKIYLDFFENTKSANIIYTTDDDGETFKIKSINHSVEEFENVKRDEVIGRRVDEVFEGIGKFGLLDIFREVYKSGEPKKMPITFYEDNKLLGWRENYVFKLSNGDVVASYEDRTQEKKLEAELRTSQHQFEQFMEYMPANVMIKDENHHIIYANKRANDFFKQESMIGKTSMDLLPEHLIETINKIDDLIIKEGTHEELLELLDENGEKLVYRNLGFKIVDDNKIKIGIVSLDITEEYRLKEDLFEQEELMIAQSRHAAMGEMISMIAHQWRQPISVIAMDANNILADIELEMLEEKSLKSTSEDIIKQTQELSKTIDDFRNFFRPERDVQEILVKELFDDALGVIGKSLDNNQIEFILELDENKKVTTYTRELMQVFINIIKNAKEALIDKKVKDKKITIYTSEDKENFKLRICDNAGGVNAEIIDKIFNPYFTTKGEKNGTGLGLYMSRTIIEKHLQGSLTVENDDEGACFEIIIPHVIKES